MKAIEMSQVTLRAATEEDAEFLYTVVKTTMREYVEAIWGWDEQWQRDYFQVHFAPEENHIVVLDAQDIGVLSTERKANEIFVDRIYILPEYQGQGIGTQLLEAVLEEAFGSGLPVRLRVLKGNPARRLYERLGFVQVNETETHYVMIATPS